MSSQTKLILSAISAALAVIYGYVGAQSSATMGESTSTATIEPLARAAAPYFINGGSLFFGLLAVAMIVLALRDKTDRHPAR